jgi:hypothetical protein
MKEEELKWLNEKSYQLIAKLTVDKSNKFKSKSKIKSLRQYLPINGETMTDFVKKATYYLLRSKDTKGFLKHLLEVLNDMKEEFPESDHNEMLSYLVGYVSMNIDIVENLYAGDREKFSSNLSKVLKAEFGEDKFSLVEPIVKIFDGGKQKW